MGHVVQEFKPVSKDVTTTCHIKSCFGCVPASRPVFPGFKLQVQIIHLKQCNTICYLSLPSTTSTITTITSSLIYHFTTITVPLLPYYPNTTILLVSLNPNALFSSFSISYKNCIWVQYGWCLKNRAVRRHLWNKLHADHTFWPICSKLHSIQG